MTKPTMTKDEVIEGLQEIKETVYLKTKILGSINAAISYLEQSEEPKPLPPEEKPEIPFEISSFNKDNWKSESDSIWSAVCFLSDTVNALITWAHDIERRVGK